MFLDDIVLNLILVMFPMLVYFIYNCYRELRCEEYKALLLDVSLFSSIYLCYRYGNVNNTMIGLLVSNLPIIVAYFKKETRVALVLSLFAIGYLYTNFDMFIIFLLLKYGSYYVVYLWGMKIGAKENRLISAIVILQGFFLSVEYFFRFSNVFALVEIVIMMLLFYLLPMFLLYLFTLADNVTNLHLTVSELEKDKQIKNSLFKITHEVKNPIAVCKGYLDMLDVNDVDKVSRYIPIIRQEIDRSLNIMNDFMEFSKINISKDIIDINLLLEEIENELKLLIINNSIKFRCKLDVDEVYIDGDYNRLKQVFINLVKNSMESIEEKGKIDIVTYLRDRYYYIEVRDNGSGMDSETLSHIKEMFFTTKVKGTGLGVSLSNEIIKAHDGSIDYQSKEGVGTKVIVKLPIVVL